MPPWTDVLSPRANSDHATKIIEQPCYKLVEDSSTVGKFLSRFRMPTCLRSWNTATSSWEDARGNQGEWYGENVCGL